MSFFKKFDNLKMKYKTNKKKILSITLTAVGIACLIIGSSMAYLIFEAEGTTQTISAGTLQLSFSNEGEAITLNNAVPQTDEQGLENTSYTVTLTNTGTIKSYYELSLNNNCTVGNSYTVNGSSVTANVCIPNDYIKIGVKIGTNDFVIKAGTSKLLTGYLEANESITFELKIWLDESTPNDYQGQTQEGTSRNVIYNGNFKIYTRQVLTNLDTSGANEPLLASNMIPVYYDGTTWRKADSTNSRGTYKWYDYANKMWANAVTVTSTNRSTYLNASLGTEIPMTDINTMWVWIPRFSAVTPSNYNGGTASAPGTIDVTFVDNETSAHDAFTFGTKNLSGFWYAKFETSHTTLASSTTNNNLGCTTETCSNANGIIIKPNVTSLMYNNVSNFFYASRSMKQSSNSFGFVSSEVDTHMSKNNEWGAVAYLTQSIYGRCTSSTSCTEIGINNSSFITGYGAPAGSDNSITNGTYNTDLGKDASTTGNIYGIYDMSGGSDEYVMGVYTDGTQNWSGMDSTYNSGFTGCLGSSCSSYTGVAYPESKYYNKYTTSSNYTTGGLQHALIETKNWYSDYALFVDSGGPWFVRGGNYFNSSSAGVFYFSSVNGNASSGYYSVRLVITNE